MASAAVHSHTEPTLSFLPVQPTVTENKKSNDVNTTLHYYRDPQNGTEPSPAYVGKPETYTLPTTDTEVLVHDIRGEEAKYSLDGNGFQIHHHESVEKDFLDEEQIKSRYYRETEQLLKDATGASRVFIFDHTIRRVRPDGAFKQGVPVQRVHVDQSYSAARNRVPFHLPEDSEKLLQTRHQIINVWRPIKTIYKDPLGVADAFSVPESDLIPVGLIYPDRRGETLTVLPNPEHRWHYLHGQTPEEVLLIKCFDSKLDGRARRVPHTAFENPAHKDNYTRESIEVRALVFHEDESAE